MELEICYYGVVNFEVKIIARYVAQNLKRGLQVGRRTILENNSYIGYCIMSNGNVIGFNYYLGIPLEQEEILQCPLVINNPEVYNYPRLLKVKGGYLIAPSKRDKILMGEKERIEYNNFGKIIAEYKKRVGV